VLDTNTCPALARAATRAPIWTAIPAGRKQRQIAAYCAVTICETEFTILMGLIDRRQKSLSLRALRR